MTDNEIITALENEVKSTEYVDSYYCNSVDLTLIKSAIGLINRQKAEIDELKHERKVLIEDIHCSADKINEQLEEIEKLKNENKILSINADNAFQDGLNEAQDLYAEQVKAEIKSEAYKEFAEHLKEMWSNNYYDSPDVDFDEFVDNLLKEMVGED